MYVALLGLLSVGSLYEMLHKKKSKNGFYVFLLLVMTAMLCFRYGQGLDYHRYEQQYDILIRTSGSIWKNTLYHGEYGFYLLMAVSKRIGLSWEWFCGLISLSMMLLTHRTIEKYSPYKVFSLLLLYPTFYFTYFYSAIRQGLALALFLGVGLPLLAEKKYFKYYLTVLLCASFHSSMYVLLLLPLILRFKIGQIAPVCVMVFLASLLAGYFGLFDFINELVGEKVAYLDFSLSYGAIIIRILLFYFVRKMRRYSAGLEANPLEYMLYKIYAFGFLIFLLFSVYPIISQRVSMPLRAVEIILIPILIHRCYVVKQRKLPCRTPLTFLKFGRYKVMLLAVVIIAYLNVELFKNVNALISSGTYREGITPYNFPYISVFDENAIYDYVDFLLYI